jgi:hypothetical protein
MSLLSSDVDHALFGLCQPPMAAMLPRSSSAEEQSCSMFAEPHSSTPAELGESQYQASDAVCSLQTIVLVHRTSTYVRTTLPSTAKIGMFRSLSAE